MTSPHDPQGRPGDPAKPAAFRQPVAPMAPPPGAFEDIRERARGRRRARALWAGLAVVCCAAGGVVAVNATGGEGQPSETVAVGSSGDSPADQPGTNASSSAGTGQESPGTPPHTGENTPSRDAAKDTCQTSQLKVTLGQGEGAAGSQYRPLNLTNTGSKPCSLFGFPGVSMVDADGKQLGRPADRAGSQAQGRVVMKPGQSEHVTLRIVNAANYGGDCHLTDAAGLRVYPPGERDSVVVKVSGLHACTSDKIRTLTVTSYGVH
mgnify:CR=1 FL=1